MLLKHLLIFGEEGVVFEKNISFQTRCITKLFERLLGIYETKDCKQINFHCGNFEDFKISECIDGFYEVLVPFNVEEFLDFPDTAKKKQTLELLKKSLDFVIEQKQWDPIPFQQAYIKVKKLNYINEFIWNKPKWSPNKKYKAEVVCTHELYNFDIKIIIKDRENEIIQNHNVISTKPDDIIYSRFLGELKWINNEEIRLYEKFPKRYVSVVI